MIKPLNLFAGRGVQHIQGPAKDFLKKELGDEKNFRLMQPFNGKVFSGEIRVFTVAGKPLAWAKKIPATGNFLANSVSGAKIIRYQPSRKEINKIEKVAQYLCKSFQLVITGMDLLGDYISEINFTSPRLLLGEDHADDFLPYQEFAKIILKKINSF